MRPTCKFSREGKKNVCFKKFVDALFTKKQQPPATQDVKDPTRATYYMKKVLQAAAIDATRRDQTIAQVLNSLFDAQEELNCTDFFFEIDTCLNVKVEVREQDEIFSIVALRDKISPEELFSSLIRFKVTSAEIVPPVS